MSSDDESTQRVPFQGLVSGGRVFGRYTLESIVGRGGMGVVWRARDEELERTVALKFLPEAVASDPEAVRDLKRETKRCLDLTHPHVVRVYDFLQDPALAAIAMEIVEGQSLAKRKAESPHGCLELREVAPLTRQLCSALEYAHVKAQVIHRDLKPANLLVTPDGELKVMDFGIARSLTETRTRLTGNASGTTSGTLLYMSPQQLMGEKPSVADDIYSLGATLFDLLAGKPPFFRGDGYALMSQIREKIPPSIAQQREELNILADRVPPEWEKAIRSCLAKEPGDRPKSAAELAARLGLAPAPAVAAVAPVRPVDVPATPPASPPASPVAPPAGPIAAGRPPGSGRNRLIFAGASLAVLAAGAGYFLRSPPPLAPGSEPARPAAQLQTSAPASVPTAATVMTPAKAEPRGGIIVRTDPAGAEVTVGSLDHGPGPLTVREVKLGKYPVKVKAAGYEDWAGEVEVKENDFAEVNAPLVRSTGSLLLTSVPAGLVAEVTGRTAPEGPATEGRQSLRTPQTVKLPTGSYTVVFRRDGWPDQTKVVPVDRSQTVEAAGEFLSGKLVFSSDPSGAEIVSGGKVIGTTPLTLSDLPPGPQSAELRLKGYKPAGVSGTLTARADLRLNAALERQRGPEAGRSVTVPGLEMELKPIAAGTFALGSPETERDRESDEGPTTEVKLTRDFWLGKTEVTQAQYELLMGANPSKFKAAGKDAPVENVTWLEAMEFCRKLTERERAEGRLPDGFAFTLPTEVQWEYACRAGTTTPFAGDVNAMAWHEDVSLKTTHSVARKTANAWGLYDMHGNVAEWCADFYDKFPGKSATDYTGPATGSRRVYRGGSWDNAPTESRSASRYRTSPTSREDYLGFRVALVTVK